MTMPQAAGLLAAGEVLQEVDDELKDLVGGDAQHCRDVTAMRAQIQLVRLFLADYVSTLAVRNVPDEALRYALLGQRPDASSLH